MGSPSHFSSGLVLCFARKLKFSSAFGPFFGTTRKTPTTRPICTKDCPVVTKHGILIFRFSFVTQLMFMPALPIQMVESALRITKHHETRQKRQRLKSATKTMLLIVMSYLICNSLRLVLTFWENISPETLKSENFKFYSLGGDVVSLLTAII